jgi:tetratricopeptide (TPR) repeat protein
LLPAPRVLRVQAQHDAGMRPWGLLRQLLTRQLGIADSDPAPRARRRLLAGVRRLLGRRAQADAHCLGQLIGMDFGASPHLQALDPRALRDAAFAACLRALQRLAQQLGAPPLLLVEDLHWADAGSVELLQHLAAAGPKLACAIVASSRPTAPGGAAAATVGAPLALDPMPAAQARAMAQALLARLDAPMPALVDRIVAQAEGNPYYLEEIVRQLLDRGVIETGDEAWTLHPERLQALELPGTLVALLQARLDALPEPARGCARQASIVGHVFWDAALAQVDAQASAELPLLDRQGLVHAQAPSTIADAAQWCFDHHLLHQVVYDTVPQRQRRSGHGAVLRWLLPRTQERGPEFLSLCALHAERAGELALALDCYDRAAQAALQRHANASARDCLRRALELLGEADPARSDGLLRRLEELADMMGERQVQQALLDERERLLERHPDDRRQADLLFARALFEDRLNRYPQAAELARRAHACAERCAHWQVAAEAQGLLSWLAYATNHIAQAREWVDAALATVQRAEPALPICRAKLEVLSAMVARVQGQPALARAALLAALERAQASGTHRLVLGCHDNLAVLALDRHDHAEAQHWIDAMQALAERTGAQPRLAHALMHRAELACAEGEPQAALDAWRRSMAITRGNGDRRNLGAALARSGRLLSERAEWAAALVALDEAAELFEDLAGGGDAALPRAHAAWCAWQLGRADEARGRAERAAQGLQLARLTDLAGSGLAARWALVQVWLALDDQRADDWLRALQVELDAAADEPAALRAAVGQACARRFPA